MSLKFFEKKCLQRRHPDVLYQRVTLATPSISSLRVTPHQVLQPFHCSLQLSQLGTSRKKISLRNPLALPVVRRSHRLCRRRQASSPSHGPEPTKTSNDSPSTRVISTVYSCSANQDFSRRVRLSTSRHLSLQDVRSRLIHFPCSSVAEAHQGLSCPPGLDWLVLDSQRLPLPRTLSAQGIVANLSSRHELVQRSATTTAPLPCLQNLRAVCVHCVQ